VLDRFLLRRAGFPFEMLTPLRAADLSKPTDDALAADSRVDDLHRFLRTEDFPAAVDAAREDGDRDALRAISRWRRGVGRSTAEQVPDGAWPEPLVERFGAWREASAEAARAWRVVAERFNASLARSRRVLYELGDLPEVREALFLSSPDFHAQLARAASPMAAGRARAFERRLYLFVQRLAAKNETASFFGPLTHGVVDGDGDDLAVGAADPRGFTHREAFFAFWAAAALGRVIATNPDVRRQLPLRRRPVVELDTNGARLPGRPPVSLSEADLAVLVAAGGRGAGPGELAAATGLSAADLGASIATLERHQLASRDIEPRSTTPYPLKDLLAALPAGPEGDRWRVELGEYRKALDRFAAAPLKERLGELDSLERRFAAATALHPRRKGGEAYADRQVLYEDCRGDLGPVRMGQELAGRIARELTPVLDFGGAYGAARHAALERLAVTVVEEGGGELGFLSFARALGEAVAKGRLADHLGEARRIASALATLVQERLGSGGREVDLKPEELAAIASPPSRPLFASPDVMLEEVAGGSPRFGLGEVQPYVFAWGSQALFADSPEALEQALRPAWDVWGGAERMATVVNRRRHKGLLTEAFPGRLVEVTACASHDDSRCLGVAELRVHRCEESLELRGPGGPLTLYAGEDELPHLQVFAPPLVEWPRLKLGTRTPRVVVGDVVVRRARWDPEEADLSAIVAAASGPPLWRAVAEARGWGGWPRRVYAHAESEPKPIYLDLEIPFAQEELRRLAGLGPVCLVEMLPDPEHLQLRRLGQRYTSELRLAMVSR
jgi:Lantibiotic dehydratase, N terminus